MVLIPSKLAAVAMKTILVAAPALTLLDAGTPDFNWAGQIERTGIVGLMAVALVVLWRTREAQLSAFSLAMEKKEANFAAAMEKKDELLRISTEQVTKALISQAEAAKELRRIIEESVAANHRLADSLNTLPCSLEPAKRRRE